jgi:lysophospholipase L1-like esterase
MDEDTALALFAIFPFVWATLLVAFFKRRQPSAEKLHWPQVLLGNALVLLLLLSTLLLTGEIYFRFFYDSTDSLAYTKVNVLWGKRHWQVNNFQMRDNVDYEPAIQPGKRRVTFVGDSFTAGHGIKNVEDRLVNRIRRANPDWEVHMLARIGADTGDELRFLDVGVSHGYQLDQVVLVYCLNDISDLMPEREQAMERLKTEIANAGWLWNSSYLFNVLGHRLKAHRDPFMQDYFSDVLKAYESPLWEQQKERLRALRDLVQTNGGRLLVITFPFLHVLGPDYKYRHVHEQLARCWDDLGVPNLDLLPLLQGQPPSRIVVNRLDVHPNEYANLLVTPAVDRFLKEQMAVNRGGPKASLRTCEDAPVLARCRPASGVWPAQ